MWVFSILALLAGAVFFAWAQYDLSAPLSMDVAENLAGSDAGKLPELDLLAQASMATSAKAMLGASAIQIALGLIGTFALVATLLATNKSFEATREGLRITRVLNEAQMRPYVGFFELSNETEGDDEVVVAIRLKNFGTTPALNVRAYTHLDYQTGHVRTFSPNLPEEINFEKTRDIQPNNTYGKKWRMPRSLVDQSSTGEGISLHQTFVVVYDDIFAKTHYCLVCVSRYGVGFKISNVFVPEEEILHPSLPKSDLRIALDEQKPKRFRYRWRWPAVREQVPG